MISGQSTVEGSWAWGGAVADAGQDERQGTESPGGAGTC